MVRPQSTYSAGRVPSSAHQPTENDVNEVQRLNSGDSVPDKFVLRDKSMLTR